MKLHPTLSSLLAGVAVSMLAGAANAQEVTLRAINSFQEGTYFARQFEAFVKKVNEEGKGLVKINYIGGPKAIPTMEQAAALRSGVVDLANTTVAYTAGLVPEGAGAELRDPAVLGDPQERRTGLPEQADAGEGPALPAPRPAAISATTST